MDLLHQPVHEAVVQRNAARAPHSHNLTHQAARQRRGVRRGAQPRLRVDHRQRGDGVPGGVPDDFLPALGLHVGQDGEEGAAGFEERGEGVQVGVFERCG